MDKELLELAAKAADMDVEWDESLDSWVIPNDEALNLAVKLRLDILIRGIETLVPLKDLTGVKHGENPYAATRRAIVRAAAEIGKEM